MISRDDSYVIAHEENDLIQANKANSKISLSTWKINENEISYEFPLYACLHLSSYSVTVNPKFFANYEVDCFLIEQLNIEKEKRDSEKFNFFKMPKLAIHEFPEFNLHADIPSNFLKYALESILQKLTPNNDDNNVAVANFKAGYGHHLPKRSTTTVDPANPMVITGKYHANEVVIATDTTALVIVEGDKIDAAKFTINGGILITGDKYVLEILGSLILTKNAPVFDYWLINDDKLYYGISPALVHLYVCEGKVSIDLSRDCEEIKDIEIMQAVSVESSTQMVSTTDEMSESSYESGQFPSTTSNESESSIDFTSIETDVSTGKETGSTTESSTESATGSVIETESETVFTSETYSSSSLVEPEPTSPLVDPLKPFTVDVLFEAEEIKLLTDGVYITFLEGIIALFQIDEEYLRVGMYSWISIEETGLMVLVDTKDDATPGWRIYDNQLYYEASQSVLRRDSEDPVAFSACEQSDGDLVLYIGDIYGCELLEIVSLHNDNSSVDPISSISSVLSSEISSQSSEESYSLSTTEPNSDLNSTRTQSHEPSVTSNSGSISSTIDPQSSVGPSDETLDESSLVDLTTILSATQHTSDESLISVTTTMLSLSTSDSISGAVILTTTSCANDGDCSEIVITVTPGWKTVSETICGPNGICDDDISTTKEFTLTTITSLATITVTTCVELTNCQTGTRIVSTVYTTYCQTTAAVGTTSMKRLGSSTTTFAHYSSKNFISEVSTSQASTTNIYLLSPKSTVTITVCSENNQCEEIVSAIAPSDTLHSYPSSVAVQESGNYYSEDHQLSPATVSAEDLSSIRIFDDATFVKSPIMMIWILISLHLLA